MSLEKSELVQYKPQICAIGHKRYNKFVGTYLSKYYLVWLTPRLAPYYDKSADLKAKEGVADSARPDCSRNIQIDRDLTISRTVL